MVIASIRKLGRRYAIDLKVLDTQKDEYLFTTKEEDEGQESILAMIDRIAEETRKGLNEKESEIQATSRKVVEVTTPNLEAYQHFFLGEQLMSHIEYREAAQEYRQAIALDSTFGLAYYRLAYAISWDVDIETLAKEPMQKALALIDRIPEKEKYLLRAFNATLEKGNTAGILILKEMEQFYPNEKEMLYLLGDWAQHAGQYSTSAQYHEKVLSMEPMHERALTHLGWTYSMLGQYEKMREAAGRLVSVNKITGYIVLGQCHTNLGEYEAAAEYFEKAVEIDSTEAGAMFGLISTYRFSRQYKKALKYANKCLAMKRGRAYIAIAETYQEMGDLTKALWTYQLGLQYFPNDDYLLAGVGRVYGFKREYDKAEAHFKAMTETQQPVTVQRTGYRGLGDFHPYLGKYAEMMKMFDNRIALHWSEKDTNSVARYTAEKAYRMFWGRGNKQEALDEIHQTLQFDNITDDFYYFFLAMLYADIGNVEKVREVAKNVRFPFWTLLIEGRVHYANGEWKQAISKNEQMNKMNPWLQPLTSFFLAQSHVKMGELDGAIAEVKKAQSFYNGWHSLTYARGFYLLGKIYEQKGNPKLAIENYEKFLDFWKNGDQDLPDLIEAKTRLTKLKKNGER